MIIKQTDPVHLGLLEHVADKYSPTHPYDNWQDPRLDIIDFDVPAGDKYPNIRRIRIIDSIFSYRAKVVIVLVGGETTEEFLLNILSKDVKTIFKRSFKIKEIRNHLREVKEEVAKKGRLTQSIIHLLEKQVEKSEKKDE